MENALEKREYTVSDLIGLLAEASDKEISEFNEVFDTKKSLEEENTFLKLQVSSLKAQLENTNNELSEVKAQYSTLKSQSDQVLGNGEKHLNTAKQAYRERDQMTDQLATSKELLKAYKEIDTPKKIKEKIKSYQTKVSDGVTALNSSKIKVKELRKENLKYVNHISELMKNETQSNMTTVWSENGDHLMLFPAKLTMQVGDHVEKQITLLYMTKSGCAKLISLDDEGIPNVCRMPPGGMKPKARTLAVAGEMLRKFKRQGWRLTTEDLDLGSM